MESTIAQSDSESEEEYYYSDDYMTDGDEKPGAADEESQTTQTFNISKMTEDSSSPANTGESDLDCRLSPAGLFDLFRSTNGKFWKKHSNWLEYSILHAWDGVSTDTSGKITELVLTQNDLNGRLEKGFAAQMQTLFVLNISDNRLLYGERILCVPPTN